jgi:AcrR family transcriptional regulator
VVEATPDPAAGTANGEAMTRRDQAVARSLDSARSRAEQRVQRFLDAALELIETGDGKEFTVQEVVERSGQSLRSFYQYFGGKHELLLALFEEAIRTTADLLAAAIADEADPGERVRHFVLEYHHLCRPPSGSRRSKRTPTPSPVLVEFAQQLLTSHPAEAARSFTPLVDLFESVLESAADVGAVRTDVDRRRMAGVVLESIMFDTFSTTIAGTSRGGDAEELWALLSRGLLAER